jgi:Tetratricopeptide repeat
MDTSGFASIYRAWMKAAAILLILAFSSFHLRAQAPLSEANPLTEIKQLLAEERWHEIVQLAEIEAERSADLNYYYGISLARLERWDEAMMAFQRGLGQQPRDKRFLLELAGICFKQKNYAEAAGYLRRAIRLDPDDTYANDFLASVYFLQGNLDAALSRWNRVSKPQLVEAQLDPTPRVDPVLLDHAFAFAPATVLSLPDLQTTRARVDGLNIFSNYRFDLEARPDGKFDLVFRAHERNGRLGAKWEELLALFRGLPFMTINPEFFNIRGRAINFVSLVRFDPEKLRLKTNLSGPFSGDPKWRYQFDLDLRDENWDIRRSSTGSAPLLGGLKLRKQAFAATATSFVNGRFDWSTGFELSHRDFRNVTAGSALTPGLLAKGFQLKHLGQLNYELMRAPEKRFILSAGASSELGRVWSQPSHIFAKFEGSIEAHWFPQGSGDDYEMQGKIRAGKTFGEIPFDELFILGVERDNDLWLRAHIGTRDGRKGSAPLGRDYFLSNWELDKNVYSNALISLKLGPFLDSGRITDSSAGLGSRIWLWDLGAQTKVRVFGLGVAFSYGKDLRSGNNAFYLSLFR